MPHTHHAHEQDPQPTIFSTKYHKWSKACNHGNYWRICKDTDCKKLVTAHDAAVLDHQNDKVIAALRAAGDRIQREEDDKRRMPAPDLPRKHMHPHTPHTHTHMTHLLGQLKSLSGPKSN